MRIDRINIYKIHLPFRMEFSISQSRDPAACILVVEAISKEGEIKGFGEGIPVYSVTGETVESTLDNIRAFSQKETFPWDLEDVSQIRDFVDSLPKGKENSAAISSLEVALLDMLGKKEGKRITEYFPQDFYADRIHYGAIIPLGDESRLAGICNILKRMGIKVLRIKMGKDLEQNKRTLEMVRTSLGEHCDIRIDPNRIWTRQLALSHLPLIKENHVRVVEEPMLSDEFGFRELVDLIQSAGAIPMACESAPTLSEVKRVIKEGYYQLVNVKLCRSGGFRRALQTIDFLRANKVPFQIGCSLGESGILSAAGRALCLLCKDAVYYDGSYDKFLLGENTTLEHVSFGQGGMAGPLEGPGLGVKLDSRKLERLSGSIKTTINNPN